MANVTLDAYKEAVNKIDDFFEYQYLNHNVDSIKRNVSRILSDLTERLKLEAQKAEAAKAPQSPPPVLSVEYLEQDCGRPCTDHGCLGHTSDVPVAFDFMDVRFEVEGYSAGDYPDSQMVPKVKAAMAALQGLVSGKA